VMAKQPEVACPMLKEYVQHTLESNQWDFDRLATIIAILGGLAVGAVSRNEAWGFWCFILLAIGCQIPLALRRRGESIEARAQRDLRQVGTHLGRVLLHERPSKYVEATVLEALERTARRYFSARQQLCALPESVSDVRSAALVASEQAMSSALGAAKPLVRRNGQSRRDFLAIAADEQLVHEVVAKIGIQEQRLTDLERDASSFDPHITLRDHLGRALKEREVALAELDTLQDRS
jgi:hypothetical protein